METTELRNEVSGTARAEAKHRGRKAVIVLALGLMGSAIAAYKFFKSKTCAAKEQK